MLSMVTRYCVPNILSIRRAPCRRGKETSKLNNYHILTMIKVTKGLKGHEKFLSEGAM